MELRDYQQRAVDQLRASFRAGHRAPLLVSPTGSGKTVLFSYVATRTQQRGKRVAILVHREELLEQVSDTLELFGTPHGIVSAGQHYDARELTHVASVFTLARRMERVKVPDLVIVDEAHHAIAGSTWGKVLREWREVNAKMQVIGVTATPLRLSGEGLGDVFDDMVLGPTTAELIESGALARYRMFAPAHTVDMSGIHKRAGDFVRGEVVAAMDKPRITGDAIEHYRRHCNGAPAIVFCASVEHAEHVAERFRAQGYRALSIDGGMDKTLRRGIVADFRRGALNVLTSCDLVSEGFDLAGIHAAILLRPTWSLALYLQQMGRALRPCEGKQAALILDHVGNSARHGLPDDAREWSLLGSGDVKKKGETVARQCPACYAIVPAAALTCKECGHEFEGQPREIEEAAGELSELDLARERREAKKAQAMAGTLEALIELGRMRGYRNAEAWARHVIQAREMKAAR